MLCVAYVLLALCAVAAIGRSRCAAVLLCQASGISFAIRLNQILLHGGRLGTVRIGLSGCSLGCANA